MKYLIPIILLCLGVALGFMWALDIEIKGVVINPKLKPYIEKYTTKTKDFIYEEATKHNPEGDTLPDYVDDKIKEEIKERIN